MNTASLSLLDSHVRPTARGLAPVSIYDPTIRRLITSLKSELARKNPIMIRLHAAARYPIKGDRAYRNDLEGHAVLLVGYDDERRSFAVMDPWNKEWGGDFGGFYWLSYKDFAMNNVNTSNGQASALTPINISARVKTQSNTRVLSVEVGMHNPRAIVMDRAVQRMTHVTLLAHMGTEIHTLSATGRWAVGESAKFNIVIPDSLSGEIETRLDVSARISGERPYPYEDNIGVTVVHKLSFGAARNRKAA
ncbi:MAG: hypothetical protein EPN70_20700 [Paraburkholderia sp.]|uniref:C39 family peptidase n=1 Tax=Paraburkholderia sp. TaxID=1926495 RepID=UPI00122A7EBB|nr:C39 family peptidase [Paraburkholderia sp.]TAM01016.1 MAG: hypothetical protein EPN70_20700 [Paraburkholderia sp.]TAM32181.1 MAG: hypothetical protein EPN59_02280 [Paraburkholderia sp.]